MKPTKEQWILWSMSFALLVVLCWWTIHTQLTCQDRVDEVVDKCNQMLLAKQPFLGTDIYNVSAGNIFEGGK